MPEPSATFISALVSILGVAGTLAVAWATRRKNLSEAEVNEDKARSAISKASIALIQPLEERVRSMDIELKNERERTQRLTIEVTALRCEIQALRSELEKVQARNHELEKLLAGRKPDHHD